MFSAQTNRKKSKYCDALCWFNDSHSFILSRLAIRKIKVWNRDRVMFGSMNLNYIHNIQMWIGATVIDLKLVVLRTWSIVCCLLFNLQLHSHRCVNETRPFWFFKSFIWNIVHEMQMKWKETKTEKWNGGFLFCLIHMKK